jgi:hypothetical protein
MSRNEEVTGFPIVLVVVYATDALAQQAGWIMMPSGAVECALTDAVNTDVSPYLYGAVLNFRAVQECVRFES